MAKSPTVLKTAGVADGQYYDLDFYFSWTSGTPTLLPSGSNPSNIIFGTTAAAPLTTAAIDAYTGLTNDILGDTAFGSTAMGTDSFGFVVDMSGQAKAAVAIEAVIYDTATLGTCVAGTSTALTNTLSTAFCCSALGNLYGRVVLAGQDAASGKIVHVKLIVELK